MNEDNRQQVAFVVCMWMLGVFIGSVLGAAIHDTYVGDSRRAVYLQAVERGYAQEIETSSGKAFVWKDEVKSTP